MYRAEDEPIVKKVKSLLELLDEPKISKMQYIGDIDEDLEGFQIEQIKLSNDEN